MRTKDEPEMKANWPQNMRETAATYPRYAGLPSSARRFSARRAGESAVASRRTLVSRTSDQRAQHEERAEAGERVEHGAPAEGHVEEAAEHGREDRGQRLRRRHEGQRPGGLLALVDVADDGAGHHGPASGAEGLEHARRDEQANAGGEGAGEAGHGVDGEAADEHDAPAEAIRERPEHELGRGQAPRERA